MKRPVYLDYNGTTPHAPEVIKAMRPYLEGCFGNPSSSHWYGEQPRLAVTRAREQVAALMGCLSKEIIFTSGGTEANNHALKSIGGSLYAKGNHIITSSIEHPAILEVCSYMKKLGFEVTSIDVGGNGIVDPQMVAEAITPQTIMISIMHANNEVGTIQPIAGIAELVHQTGRNDILLHSDGAQSVGKIPVRVDELGVDLISLAGHKIYGPKGVGALYVRSGIDSSSFCHGAGQESGRRAGTENVLEIVGLGMACEIAARDLEPNANHMKRMRDRLEHGLLAAVGDIRINGDREKRLPNTASISFYGIDATSLLAEIGDQVAVSAGAACHSEQVHISHVLEAMAIPTNWAAGTLRFSTGRMTTTEEIDRTLEVVVAAVQRLREGK